MNKLFSMEDYESQEALLSEDSPPEVAAVLQEYRDDLELATEAFKTASGHVRLLTDITHRLDGKERASVDYFTSLESYSLVMASIADSLGVKNRVPSLEDFRNPYGTEASHAIAMEGFYDYIKKIWEKIRDLFSAFFKKVSLFFKRLVGAKLDLEEYNRYLDELIGKIKVKKGKLSDNTVQIESKLPALLGNPGMEKINTDFLFATGLEKLNTLTYTTNEVFGKRLRELVDKDTKQLLSSVEALLRESKNPELAAASVQEQLDAIRRDATAVLNKLFVHEVPRLQDLPDTAYDAIQHQFDRNELTALSIRSLVDCNNFTQSLPRQFNAFYALSEANRIYVYSCTEADGYTDNHLNPIGTVDNLVRFYEYYKKFTKQFDVKRLGADVAALEKRLDEITTLMKNRFVGMLEALAKTPSRASPVSMLQALEALEKFYVDLYQSVNEDAFAYMDKTRPSVVLFSEVPGIVSNNLGLPGDIKLQTKNGLIEFYRGREEEFIDKVVQAIGGANFQPTGLSDEERRALIKAYEDLQKFLLNYFNSIQVVVKDITQNLVGVHTELQYEMARFIYNSAKLYQY